MVKRIIEWFESLPATVISGVFLACSFLPVPLPFSPVWVTVVISGTPLVYTAIRKVCCNRGIRKISSALLITIAMVAAIAIGDLFAAGEVAFIMAIGEILEDLTAGRAKKGLKKLLQLAPTQGRLLHDGKERLIPAADIRVGDILRILPGETIPVDGVVLKGETTVDQSAMTGESLPVEKQIGDTVYGGTVNSFGTMDIRATKVGEDSSLQTLIRMVKNAEEKKAPMARIADTWACFLVPAALLAAVLTLLITRDIVRAVTVLVVFCPCALVLATPTAIMAAIGQATRHGVLIKSGEALEKMGKVDTLAFDKTGTLTTGSLTVCDCIPLADVDADAVLTLAACAESKSEHPLGKAIVAAATKKGLPLTNSDTFHMTAGEGVHATFGTHSVRCGNERFLAENGVDSSEAQAQAVQLRAQGKAVILVASDNTCIGIVALSDSLRPAAADALCRLRALQVEPVLLTGDNHITAAHIAERLGISKVHAALLPAQKTEAISALQAAGKTVCMIGDGVNDAPALKTADVGVAMGSMGSDIAVEAADIALMNDDLSKLPYLKRLSVATVRTIKLSITLSMLINFFAVLCSVMGWLNPTTGALVHNAGSVFVVLLAALLYDRKFK